MVGARRRMRLMYPRPLTGTISPNKAFTRWEDFRRRWALPPLVRIILPDPVMLNRFEVALWVFSLNFPTLCLRGTILTPSHQIPRVLPPEVVHAFQELLQRFLCLFSWRPWRVPATWTCCGPRWRAPVPRCPHPKVPGQFPSSLRVQFPGR